MGARGRRRRPRLLLRTSRLAALRLRRWMRLRVTLRRRARETTQKVARRRIPPRGKRRRRKRSPTQTCDRTAALRIFGLRALRLYGGFDSGEFLALRTVQLAEV